VVTDECNQPFYFNQLSVLDITVQSTANNGLERNSKIIAIEPNTFDKRRLVKYLGELEPEILDEVQQKLRIYLNL
jgi:mRNA interferase MazF